VPILILTAKELSKKEKGRLYGDVDRIFQKGDYTRTELLEEIRQLTGETVSN
ncbi:MAG: hypothetical protein GWM98_30460, partial [Nitrospinaceae bacterium]|nr:hypothetical protein [Nitrospinaceae bacterium]NIR57993.1 hypothetical protein [Nitrospinaceae bacterium]NIS88455.1 hypothetical protein [Nitrospinaceae bacterium]NIT85335.1 hypothetical protein [Nitrospinaceae bacterium]NIU47486.1 hypothetical protein [Nitrospinaceae bacterium]